MPTKKPPRFPINFDKAEEMAARLREATPAALEYHRYPMWLNHKSLDPVIVYSAEQEAEYRAKGFEPPGTADPNGYLVSKVSAKLDDAIRAMNERVEAKIRDGLRDLSAKITELVRAEVAHRKPRDEYGDEYELNLAVDKEIRSATSRTTTDIMSVVRDIAKGTRYDG